MNPMYDTKLNCSKQNDVAGLNGRAVMFQVEVFFQVVMPCSVVVGYFTSLHSEDEDSMDL